MQTAHDPNILCTFPAVIMSERPSKRQKHVHNFFIDDQAIDSDEESEDEGELQHFKTVIHIQTVQLTLYDT